MKTEKTEEERVIFYDSRSSMNDVKELMNIIDSRKDSKYFKEVWEDIENYEKRLTLIKKKEEKKEQPNNLSIKRIT